MKIKTIKLKNKDYDTYCNIVNELQDKKVELNSYNNHLFSTLIDNSTLITKVLSIVNRCISELKKGTAISYKGKNYLVDIVHTTYCKDTELMKLDTVTTQCGLSILGNDIKKIKVLK